MNFCPECESYLTKNITPNDEIVFSCYTCKLTVKGTPDDTLLEEEYMEASTTDLIHEQFVENSAFDDAANIVDRNCKKCGLNYMIKIRIGVLMTVRYTCTCGNIEVD
jgi:DNA-directed RNA polymerase subunit M/transcription elongation factor TFIIS